MNILGLVFSLLLILTYAFYASWDKQSTMSRVRSTHIAHQATQRKLLNHFQSEMYQALRGKATQTRAKKQEAKPQPVKVPELNGECAKINLFPLTQEGRETHPLLYEFTAKLLRTFYGPFQEKRLEYRFLDTFLESAKLAVQEENFVLEKIALTDSQLQPLYYKMLKGTKEEGRPSLLDYFKLEKGKGKICLFHAHPKLMEVFFGPHVAPQLFEEIHRQDGSLLTKELIEKFCSEAHQIAVDPELLALFDYEKPEHPKFKKTLLAEDRQADIYLRKNVYLKS